MNSRAAGPAGLRVKVSGLSNRGFAFGLFWLVYGPAR